jgi:branched-chain amino acid transport system substrate-binding protein
MGTRGAAALVAVTAASLGLTACGGGGGNAGESADTITLGMVSTFEGATAASGQAQLSGARIAIDMINAKGGVMGKKLALRTVNETGQPVDSANAVRTLTSDGIGLLFGFSLTPDCAAAAPVAKQEGAMMFGTCTGAQFRSATDFPAFWSVSSFNTMQSAASAYVLGKLLRPEELDTFAYDYAEGHDAWAAVQADMRKLGLNFTTPVQTFVPLSATSYRSQVSAMVPKLQADVKNRVLALLTYGSGTITFLKEAQQFNLLSRFSGVFADGQYYLGASALGKAAPSVWNSYDYCDYQAYKNPTNDAFVAEYHKRTGKYPNDWVEQGYTQVVTYAQAIEKAQSTDAEKVSAALSGLTVKDTPIGSFDFNLDRHQANINVVTCNTVGDASAPDGLRLVKAEFVPPSVTLAG